MKKNILQNNFYILGKQEENIVSRVRNNPDWEKNHKKDE